MNSTSQETILEKSIISLLDPFIHYYIWVSRTIAIWFLRFAASPYDFPLAEIIWQCMRANESILTVIYVFGDELPFFITVYSLCGRRGARSTSCPSILQRRLNFVKLKSCLRVSGKTMNQRQWAKNGVTMKSQHVTDIRQQSHESWAFHLTALWRAVGEALSLNPESQSFCEFSLQVAQLRIVKFRHKNFSGFYVIALCQTGLHCRVLPFCESEWSGPNGPPRRSGLPPSSSLPGFHLDPP